MNGRRLVFPLVLASSLLASTLAVVAAVSDSPEGRGEVVWSCDGGWPEGRTDIIEVESV